VSEFIDSLALADLKRALGMAGQGSGSTALDSANLQQTIDVARIVRRSRTTGFSGFFTGILENVHSAADGERSEIFPYSPGPNNFPPYPGVVPNDLDVWLIGCSGARTSGAGALAGATFSINLVSAFQGWGQDDAGAGVAAGNMLGNITVARFDSIDSSVTASTFDPMKTDGGQAWVPVGLRLPRGCRLRFETEAGAAAEFQGLFLLGLFPITMGQDIAT